MYTLIGFILIAIYVVIYLKVISDVAYDLHQVNLYNEINDEQSASEWKRIIEKKTKMDFHNVVKVHSIIRLFLVIGIIFLAIDWIPYFAAMQN